MTPFFSPKDMIDDLFFLFLIFSDVILQKGIAVIVDAQKSTARITRQHARYIYSLFEGLKVSLYLVKSEGFWEKHVETCTKGQAKGEVRFKCSSTSAFFCVLQHVLFSVCHLAHCLVEGPFNEIFRFVITAGRIGRYITIQL